MSKINIYSSVEDEFFKIALDSGWIKEGQESKPDYFTETTNPAGQSVPQTPVGTAPWEPMPQSKMPQQSVAPTTQVVKPTPVKPRIYKSPLIEQVQQVLLEAGYNPGDIDGIWGKNTSKAWNDLSTWYKKNYGSEIGLTNPIKPPTQENMGWVVEKLAPAIVKKPAKQIQQTSQVAGKPADVDLAKRVPTPISPFTGPAVKEHIPAMADDDFLKEAEMPFTPKQKKVIENVMQLKNVDFDTAIIYAKQFYPNIFTPPQVVTPKVKDYYEEWAEQAGKPVELPKAEDILKGIDEKMKGFKPYQQTKGRDNIEVTAPKPISTFPTAKEHIPSFNDDGILTNAAFVINELIVLANDLDIMGETQAANTVDQQLKVYKEAMDNLYDVTGETGEKFIGTVHPAGPVMVPAKDDGGKIENIIEQQKKDLEIVTKNPTGKYAILITKLIATANRLDEEGDEEGSRIVDKTIAELRERVLPFVNRNAAFEAAGSKDNKASVKQAGVSLEELVALNTPAVPSAAKAVVHGAKAVGKAAISGVGAASTAIGTAFGAAGVTATAIGASVIAAAVAIPAFAHYGSSWFSQSETIAADIQDLIDYANKLQGEDPKIPALIQRLEQVLSPFKQSLSDESAQLNYLTEHPDQIGKLAQEYSKFGPALATASNIVNMIGELSEDWTWNPLRWNFFNTHKRLVSKLDDLKKSYGQQYIIFNELVKGAQQLGTKEIKQTESGSMEKVKKEEFSKYIGTLDKLMNVFSKNNRTVEKVFGNGATQKWMEKLEEEKELAKKYDWKTLQNSNDAIYNRLIPILRGHKIWASNKNTIIKKLGAGIADLLKNLPEAPKAKGKTTPGKGKGVRLISDPQVKALQEALLALNISVGKRGADGFWGPDTAKAYNTFIESHSGVERFIQPIANPVSQRHVNRPAAVLQKATQIVQYFSGKEKEVGSSTIQLSGDLNVPLRAMQSAQTFVDYMQTALSSQSFPPASALQYLGELSRYVSDYEADMEGKQPGSVRKWQAALFNLTREFQKYERQAKTQTGVSGRSDLMNPWAAQNGFKYPWDAQEGAEGDENGTIAQKYLGGAPGATGYARKQSGAGLNSPDGALKALYQFRPDMFEDPELFKTKAMARGKNPEQYLQEIYAMLGKIGNALDTQERQIRGSKFGDTKFDEAQTYLVDISGALKRLGDRLNTSLFAAPKPVVAPKTAP
jgi:peptidoglycan hydrolase-like protein with peptidoglycan-binding domain